jgi:hypothetical protein
MSGALEISIIAGATVSVGLVVIRGIWWIAQSLWDAYKRRKYTTQTLLFSQSTPRCRALMLLAQEMGTLRPGGHTTVMEMDGQWNGRWISSRTFTVPCPTSAGEHIRLTGAFQGIRIFAIPQHEGSSVLVGFIVRGERSMTGNGILDGLNARLDAIVQRMELPKMQAMQATEEDWHILPQGRHID